MKLKKNFKIIILFINLNQELEYLYRNKYFNYYNRGLFL